MSILSSPFLTLSIVDTALKSAQDPGERVRLLSARVHLLQSPPDVQSSNLSSTPALTTTANPPISEGTHTTNDTPLSSSSRPSGPPADRTPLLAARLALADAYLALPTSDLHAASSEAMAVEGECRRLSKASKRWESPPSWLNDLSQLRKRALLVLATVDEGLGRPSRAERSRALANEL